MNADHIVKSFDRDLQELDRKIVALGKACEHQLSRTIEALINIDRALAGGIVENDHMINTMQKEVEEYSVFLIAKRQPVATDLRHAVSGFKISSELERIGDYAANIAKRITTLKTISLPEPVDAVIQMLTIAKTMMTGAMGALLEMDINRAITVWKSDDEIDHIYSGMMTSLKTLMERDPDRVDDGTLLIQMARCCERIGDHITNIAETIYYIDSGQRYIGNLD